MIEAHAFFRQEALRWISGEPDSDGAVPPGSEELRVEALRSTLHPPRLKECRPASAMIPDPEH
jgi:hypothetical protein